MVDTMYRPPLPPEPDAPPEPLADLVITLRNGSRRTIRGLPLSLAAALQAWPADDWYSLRIVTRAVDRFDQSA